MNNSHTPRIAFFGSPEFAARILRFLGGAEKLCAVTVAVTQPDRPAGRGGNLTPSPVKVEAERQRIPVLQPERISKSTAEFLDQLSQFGPYDLGIVVAFGQILPSSVLSFPRMGCLNIHASLLPRWRGAAPIQRAILAGDSTTGICLMRMDEGLDTGPVYSEEAISISEATTYGTLHDDLCELAISMLRRDLSRILDGSLVPRPQSDDGATYAKKILNEEARINWKHPATEIARMVRALTPVPGAFTELRGARLKVFNATHKHTMSHTPSRPGTVCLAERAQLEVQCGDGVLCIHELQLAGRSRMSVEEFIKGSHLAIGDILGNTEGAS